MADKIVVLSGGRVEQIGAPLDLYDRPANRFVAGFIGSPSMNFIDGTVGESGFKTDGITLPCPSGLPAGTRATYGIRPEHFALSPEGIKAEILVIEPMGSETQVTMELGETSVIGLFRERISGQPGDTIGISIDPAKAHLFDAATDERIG